MKNSDLCTNRSKQIEELSKFIDSKEKWLSELIGKTGWTLESLLQEKYNVQCPYNPHHWLPPSSMEKHVKMCALAQKGYLAEDLEKEPPSSSFFYGQSTSAVPVYIDQHQLNTIICEANAKIGKQLNPNVDGRELPQTMDRYFTEFSLEERLAVYDYVVEKAKAVKEETDVSMQDLMVDFKNTNSESTKPKTYLEMLAEQRDYKRRRQSYRAKNVHTTKKSYTEVMKEVIENQMQYLTETQKEAESIQDISDRVESNKQIQKEDVDVSASEQTRKSDEESVTESGSRRKSKKHHHHHHHKRKRSRSRSRHREKHKKHRKHTS